jgi:hypothetical protein
MRNILYIPEQNIAAANRDAREISYPIWAGPREGDVQLRFIGLTDLEKKKGEAKSRTAHLQMKITNDSKGEWTLNTQDIYLSIPGQGKNRPAYVDTNVAEVPKVSVKSGEDRVIDFYFPLPEEMNGATQIPDFSLDWEIQVPERKIAQRTEFERVSIERYIPVIYAYPAYPYGYGFGAGWGPGPSWWYDPFWPPWPHDTAISPPKTSAAKQSKK